ncbi:MAG: hypothetical protein ACREYC_22225 [Gammaproteobacteria bacterium]
MAETRKLRPSGTTVGMESELSELGVNPALDNRTGDQRPRRDDSTPQQIDGPEITSETHASGEQNTALKPQQIPGPETGDFAGHDERARREHPEWFTSEKDTGKPLGMRSEGPHGRGEDK